MFQAGRGSSRAIQEPFASSAPGGLPALSSPGASPRSGTRRDQGRGAGGARDPPRTNGREQRGRDRKRARRLAQRKLPPRAVLPLPRRAGSAAAAGSPRALPVPWAGGGAAGSGRAGASRELGERLPRPGTERGRVAVSRLGSALTAASALRVSCRERAVVGGPAPPRRQAGWVTCRHTEEAQVE